MGTAMASIKVLLILSLVFSSFQNIIHLKVKEWSGNKNVVVILIISN